MSPRFFNVRGFSPMVLKVFTFQCLATLLFTSYLQPSFRGDPFSILTPMVFEVVPMTQKGFYFSAKDFQYVLHTIVRNYSPFPIT